MFRNLIYLPYFFLKTPGREFWNNVNYLMTLQNRSKLNILLDIVQCSIMFSTSFMDYFLLRFFRKSTKERKEYAGTGFMYEYQLKMNPKGNREILSDKIKFFEHYSGLIGRKWFRLQNFSKEEIEICNLIKKSKKLVLKNSQGQAGKEVEVIDSVPYPELIAYMKNNDFDLLEEFVLQHSQLQALAPNGLNTVRIITQLTSQNDVEIIGTILRLSIFSNTDNLTAGNAAALIDQSTGRIIRKAVYGDFKKEDIEIHPVSGIKIVGFEIPYWKETLDMVKIAAKQSNWNRSIGWDVALTNNGPILIEGNHNWGRTLWQLPEDRGLKSIIEKNI